HLGYCYLSALMPSCCADNVKKSCAGTYSYEFPVFNTMPRHYFLKLSRFDKHLPIVKIFREDPAPSPLLQQPDRYNVASERPVDCVVKIDSALFENARCLRERLFQIVYMLKRVAAVGDIERSVLEREIFSDPGQIIDCKPHLSCMRNGGGD